jgi:hypothetical protein
MFGWLAGASADVEKNGTVKIIFTFNLFRDDGVSEESAISGRESLL